MSTNRNQKAYIRIDGSGRDVAGSLILRNKKPGNGKWREILAYECCNLVTTTTTENPLAVGKFYSGGIIASSSIIDNQVMIVSLEDLGTATWYNGSFVTIGTTATGLKTGSANTDSIISTQGAGTYAASLTRDNILPWGLPSKDELNEVYVNIAVINTGMANNGGDPVDLTSFCWSSTEYDINSAWFQSFYDGFQNFANKVTSFNVRAVRWVNI
jgi:hypothetical protein